MANLAQKPLRVRSIALPLEHADSFDWRLKSSRRQRLQAITYLRALDKFRSTAARIKPFNAASSILSPSWKSIARLTFPSRLELNSLAGSFNEAPFAKVSFTTLL